MASPAGLHQLKRADGLVAVAVAAAATIAYLPAMVHAIGVWRLDEEFSFGFLVPPVVLGLVIWRWRAMVAARRPGPAIALVALISGLGLLLAGGRIGVNALAGGSFLPVELGAVGFLYGLDVARLSALPAILLAGAMSLYRGLLSSVGFGLQLLTAQGAAVTATAIGLPVRRSGVDLFARGVHLVVAQACSGMDSLLALLCLTTLLVGVVPVSWTRRAALITLVLPIILVANVTRITLVLLLAQPFGLAVAQGLLHGLLSASLFVAASVLLGLAALALRCVPRFAGTPSSPA